jgi:hypothetical protein
MTSSQTNTSRCEIALFLAMTRGVWGGPKTNASAEAIGLKPDAIIIRPYRA